MPTNVAHFYFGMLHDDGKFFSSSEISDSGNFSGVHRKQNRLGRWVTTISHFF